MLLARKPFMPAKMDPTVALVVFGRSQMGKSLLVNRLIARSGSGGGTNQIHHLRTLAPVGTGHGKSTTTDVTLYPSTCLGPVVDVPGYEDSELRFEPANVGAALPVNLVSHSVTKLKVLVLESLADSTMQLRATLEQLVLALWGCALAKCGGVGAARPTTRKWKGD